MLPRDLQPWDIQPLQYEALQAELRPMAPNSIYAQVLTRPNHPDGVPARAIGLGGANDLSRAAGFIVMLGPNGFINFRSGSARPGAIHVLSALRAASVTGPLEQISQLTDGLPVGRVDPLPLTIADTAVTGLAPDPRVHPATREDIPAIQQVLAAGGFGEQSKSSEAAAVLGPAVDLGIVVVTVEDERVVAVATASGWTERWLLADTLAVHPDYRRRGLAVAVGAALAASAHQLGLGACWLHGGTNTMNLPDVPLTRSMQHLPWGTLHLDWPQSEKTAPSTHPALR